VDDHTTEAGRKEAAPESVRITYRATESRRKALGSHYRFGAISGTVGVFAALEYKFGGSEPFWGLTVRSVTDGSIVFHRPLKSIDAGDLLNDAGLILAIHPSGSWRGSSRSSGRGRIPTVIPRTC